MKAVLIALLASGLAWADPARAESDPRTIAYQGMCDASAAVAINENLFVVANDEDNVLRVYRRGQPGEPQRIDLSGLLKVGDEHPEVDIEGATRIGDTIYWISSHGQNKNGKNRPNRHRFFATRVIVQGDKVELKPEGQAYVNLRADLIAAPELKGYGLADAAKLAPEATGGFNIEGLAARPEGGVLIAFRNPLKQGNSIVVPLLNPQDLVQGRKPSFGTPLTPKLGQRGIRSLEYSEQRKLYLIVAGPTGDDGKFALFTWDGTGDKVTPLDDVRFPGLNPEAMFAYPGETKAIEFLSDDGGVEVNGKACKEGKPADQRFRAFSLSP